MKILRITSFLLLITLAFFACGKKEDAKPKTTKEILTGTVWKVDKTDFNVTLANGLIPLPDSLKQNPLEQLVGSTLEFKADGSMTVTPTAGNGAPITNIKWELIENDTKIKFVGLLEGGQGGGGDLPIDPEQLKQLETYTIVQLKEKNFDLKNSVKFKVPIQGIPFPVDVEVKTSLFMIPK
jgi:hypothetical protein